VTPVADPRTAPTTPGSGSRAMDVPIVRGIPDRGGLEGRVALVTGAAGSAGRAVVAGLAGAGARLALFGTRVERLHAVADELGLETGRWLARAVDLRDADSARRAVEDVSGELGRPSILVHLVGGWTGGTTVVDTPDAEFSGMLDQHLWTTLNVVRAVLPGLTEAGWGRMIVVSSPTATNPIAKMGAYAVGKAAEETLVATIAREVAGTGITANILQVRTIDAQGERRRAPTAKNASWTTPEEIAAAVLYLCSDGAAAINGARIPLFGAG
jgi:NAD(P)-dependent dehydrogenase (short-subunit alcohol dehydrogenase family)